MRPGERAVTAMYGFYHQRAPGLQDVSGGGLLEETLPESPGLLGSLEVSTGWEGGGMSMGLPRLWNPQQGPGQLGTS